MKLKGTGKYAILALCISVMGILLARFVNTNADEDSDLQLVTVSPRSFDIKVNMVGVLDAARSHMVSSTIRGDKAKIIYLIDEGSRVNEGDVLVQIDQTPFEEEVHRLSGEVLSLKAAVDAEGQMLEWEKNQVEREIRTAEFNLKVAELELKKIVEGDGPLQLAQLKEDIQKAKEEYARYLSYIRDLEELSNKGFANPTEISLAKGKTAELKEKHEAANKKYVSYKEHVLPSLVETARAKVEQAEMELEQTGKGSVFKVAKALSSFKEVEGKLENAKASLKQAQSELEKTTIRAPFSGIAVLYEAFRDGQKRKPRVGDRVLQNQPLLYLPDISSMIVETRVREVDLHKIALNQTCSIRIDACPAVLFEGKVTFIGVLASQRFERGSGEKYFQITLSLKGEDSRLRPGMTARVSILTDNVKNALSAPVQAIFDEGGRKYCYVYTGHSFRKAEVSLGKQNEDFAEIVSGLKKGDKVSLVKPPQEEIE
jgi:HlyD family secretion protein